MEYDTRKGTYYRNRSRLRQELNERAQDVHSQNSRISMFGPKDLCIPRTYKIKLSSSPFFLRPSRRKRPRKPISSNIKHDFKPFIPINSKSFQRWPSRRSANETSVESSREEDERSHKSCQALRKSWLESWKIRSSSSSVGDPQRSN